MAGFSISVKQGAAGLSMSSYTIGTLTPNADDVEVRVNNLNSNSKNISNHEVVVMLRNIIRVIETGGPSAINLIPRTGTTPPPPLV